MGEVDNAMKVFQLMPSLDTIAWNTAIFGLGEHDQLENAIKLFIKMKPYGSSMNEYIFFIVLNICRKLPSLNLGQQIHPEAIKLGIMDCFIEVGTALINMYFKCGDMDSALHKFNFTTCYDTFSWSSVICGLARHGHGEKAIEMFEKMRLSSSVKPDEVSFVGVLSACKHAGLLELGKHYFNLLKKEYFQFEITKEHYSCMVDLLGRYGEIDKAKGLVNEMKSDGVEVNASVCGALLVACERHNDMVVGEIAGEKVLELQPSDSGTYMILAKMYMDNGRREETCSMWNRMRANGVKKQPGCSWIESSHGRMVFFAGDTRHAQFQSISFAINLIYQEMGFLNYGASRL